MCGKRDIRPPQRRPGCSKPGAPAEILAHHRIRWNIPVAAAGGIAKACARVLRKSMEVSWTDDLLKYDARNALVVGPRRKADCARVVFVDVIPGEVVATRPALCAQHILVSRDLGIAEGL